MSEALHISPGDGASKFGELNLADAEHFIELIAGRRDAVMCFRFWHDGDKSRPAHKADGPIRLFWPSIVARQDDGYGVGVVVNEGGQSAKEIKRVRAMFVDGDDIPLPPFWHAQPRFLCIRDDTHWHAYWPMSDMPLADFRAAQLRAVAFYGSDPAVADLPHVMRLPGTFNLKDPAVPVLLRLEEL
jgi:hypothetical protein